MTPINGMLRFSQRLNIGIGCNWMKTSQCFTYQIPASINNNCGFATSVEDKLGLNKPKRPAPSFFKFLKQVRPTLVSKNPGVSNTDIIKLAGKHWEQLSEDVKNEMNGEYLEELKEYKKKNSEFKETLTPEQKDKIDEMKSEKAESKEKRRVKLELKELGRPKKPMSSYLYFLQSEKDKFKTNNVKERTAIATKKWNAMSPQEKAVFQKKAQEAHDAYQKQMIQWEQKMIRMGNIDYVRNKALVPEKYKAKNTKSE